MANAQSTAMTVRKVADYLWMNQRMVYCLTVDSKLPAFKIGATWEFKRTAIDPCIKSQGNQPNVNNLAEGQIEL
ncbi:MAG: helix-turn-helix domain-containing protein [Proteobacteria bacterium]|nr:helix-turn-helix domain-containing protein [Pseudomonadota bacterium]